MKMSLKSIPFPVLALAMVACMLSSTSAQDSGDYFRNWFPRLTKTQAEQPHWITPLFTTTPRLEEEFRADIIWTPARDGDNLNYLGGKGLELIPTEHTEIILGLPPYEVPVAGPDGFANIPLTLKYRFAAANEERGNYIVTAFLAGSIPYGRFATPYPTITPTIAFGKGYRNFDFQSTLGWTIPTGGRQKGVQHGLSVSPAAQAVARGRSQCDLLAERNAEWRQTGVPFSRSGSWTFSHLEASGPQRGGGRTDRGHALPPVQSCADAFRPLSLLRLPDQIARARGEQPDGRKED